MNVCVCVCVFQTSVYLPVYKVTTDVTDRRGVHLWETAQVQIAAKQE